MLGLKLYHVSKRCPWWRIYASRNWFIIGSLQRHHNEHDGISNHQRLDGLLNCLFRRRSKNTSKLHITGLCAENSPVTDEFPSQRASNAENVPIWWRHHVRQWFGTHLWTIISWTIADFFLFFANKFYEQYMPFYWHPKAIHEFHPGQPPEYMLIS